MPATFYGGVFGSSRSGSSGEGGGEGGITEARVNTLIAASRELKGLYNAETTYAKGNTVEHEYGFARSRVDGNLGNDPLTDNGTNWLLFMNGSRMTEWWGRNQTEGLPTASIAANQVISSEGIIGFTGTAGGDASENGGVPGITLVDVSAETDADPTVSLANSGIPIPPGRYEIIAEFYGNQQPDDDVHIRMIEVMSGTDDIIRLIGTQRQKNFVGTAVNDVHAHYEMSRNFRVTSQSTFYFKLLNYGTGANAQNRIVGYFQIERIA